MPPLNSKPEAQETCSTMEEIAKLKPSPVLRLHLDELSHPATSSFLTLIDSAHLLPNAISQVIKHLYAPLNSRTQPTPNPIPIHIPPTRSVTLILRRMDGVAYTTGLTLDPAHKEIHLSAEYASRFGDSATRFRDEVIGVVTHEMVHAYQWDAQGSCPPGLIEGIADYVRLCAGLAPPHWRRDELSDRWDEGYQRTAYFLEYLEEEYGPGTVARINAALREAKYQQESFWTGIFGEGKDVEWLFKRYRDSLKETGVVPGDGKERDCVKGPGSEDGVLVELKDAEKMVVGAKFDQGEDGSALRR